MVIVTGLEEVTNGLKHPNFQNRIHSGTVGARSFSKSQGNFIICLLLNNLFVMVIDTL